MCGQPKALQLKQDLPKDDEELSPSEAEVGEMRSADDDGPAEVVPAALRADGVDWLLLGDAVKETDAEAWVLVEDAEADEEAWILVRDAISETKEEDSGATASAVEFLDANEVAGKTVVEVKDGNNEEAGESKTDNFILVGQLTPSETEVGEMRSDGDNGTAEAVAAALRADAGAWVLIEDAEADEETWILVGDAISETEEENGGATAFVVEFPDASDVAGDAVVEV
ncbi:hypothetical protein ACROYT_G015816 [Oculina patagonica]